MNTGGEPAPGVSEAEPARGGLEGDWFYEEGRGGNHRLGIRIRERLHEEQSSFQKIAVYDTEFFGRFLTLDDVVMFTERDEFVYHEMLVHVPLATIPCARSVLIVGGGDAGCLREALKWPSVERVVLCEIDERVTRVSEQFFPWVTPAISDSRVELVFADGIDLISGYRDVFDLIVIDSTDPQGPAVGLFRRAFYESVSNALKPGGVMTAQTESPHWDTKLVGSIFTELRAAFPVVSGYLGSIPTYPSGSWSWAYASRERRPEDFFDTPRSCMISEDCLYYTPDLQRAAFALPRYARMVIHQGQNPFARFESTDAGA